MIMKNVMKKLIFLFSFLLSGFLPSCIAPNPENSLNPEEKDVYITNYDPSGKFSSYKTYSISDSVVYSSNQDTTVKKERGNIDIITVSAIKSAMQQKGYTYVANNQNPDVGISVNRVNVISTGTAVSYPYGYGSGSGYGYGGYGGYYGNPAYIYNYQVTNDALILQMVDLKDHTDPKKLKVVWEGEVLGDFSPNQSVALEKRLTDGIQNIFTQSTYLNK